MDDLQKNSHCGIFFFTKMDVATIEHQKRRKRHPIVKILNLYTILLWTHLYHLVLVSIHSLKCIHCLSQIYTLVAPGYLIGLLNLLCEHRVLSTSALVTCPWKTRPPLGYRQVPPKQQAPPIQKSTGSPTVPFQNPKFQDSTASYASSIIFSWNNQNFFGCLARCKIIFSWKRQDVLYILTSVWVLRTPNAGRNSHFQRFFCKKA